LVAERYNTSAALLVTRMLGLRNLHQFEIRPAPVGRAWESVHYVDREGQIWRELSMNDLVYDNDFLQAGL
jgi:twitching motility protein PilI